MPWGPELLTCQSQLSMQEVLEKHVVHHHRKLYHLYLFKKFLWKHLLIHPGVDGGLLTSHVQRTSTLGCFAWAEFQKRSPSARQVFFL